LVFGLYKVLFNVYLAVFFLRKLAKNDNNDHQTGSEATSKSNITEKRKRKLLIVRQFLQFLLTHLTRWLPGKKQNCKNGLSNFESKSGVPNGNY